MATLETLEHILTEAGVYQFGRVDTADIRFLQEVRGMCEANTCRQYGKTWACPPAIGTVEECRARVQQYDAMLVFSVKCDLEDSFDYEGMVEGGKRFKRIARAIQQAVSRELDDYLLLSNEGCDQCKECTYPDAPCRHPDYMLPSVEGQGILVTELAERHGMTFLNGSNVVTWFSLILYAGEKAAL